MVRETCGGSSAGGSPEPIASRAYDPNVTPDATTESPSRFVVGIDLGTTNSAAAYVDTDDARWRVRDFPIPQLVAPGEVEARQALPSFHYEAAAGEFPPGAMRLPWDAPGADPRHAAGAFARDHGAAVPGRLVVSAKSWLSHSGVDRTAGLLPWHGAPDATRLSPVDAGARYLAHVRSAWDHAHPDHPLARQDVVLGVPASFDEVARELTVRAARQAGLVRLVLLEEPQAAFYAWIHGRGTQWGTQVEAGQTILVCDVGGGTSDFTLIRVRPAANGKVSFHRVAVGEHLILGGDNLDLALAHHVERRLKGEGGRLDPRQFAPLVRACRAAKETLLGNDPPARLTVSVGGGGAKLIGGATQVELTRDEVHGVLVEGFLPRVGLDERPASRRSGFQEFGLPYAPDPAVTRYLAAFLSAHRKTAREGDGTASADHDPARPDLVLFNGGLFESPVLRERLIDVLTGWFRGSAGDGWSPTILKSDRLDLAVARGAAYYGMVRRGKGVRIAGGLAHSYYLGVETSGQAAPAAAVCLLPAGVEEGRTVDLPGRTFNLLIRQPAEFPLYYSATRTTDPPGHLLAVDPEQLTALPPIRTVLQSGRGRSDADVVPVALHAKLTEVGTLDIWCGEVGGERQWRLQFDVRAASRAELAAHEATAADAEGVVDEAVAERCRGVIRAAFRKNASGATEPPAGVVKRLEQATGTGRYDWPSSLMRAFWETLMEVEPGRGLSLEHEARWLSLTGFCLRPGYGMAVDDWRVAQTWRLVPAEIAHHKNELVRAEWWILWRRVAGGLSAGQQTTLTDPLVAAWRTYARKAAGPGGGGRIRWQARTFQFGPHESAESWRTLGSMELLKPDAKAELGSLALDLLAREKAPAVRDALLFAVGRLGARVPVYGPLNALVAAGTAEGWARQLIEMRSADEKAAFAVVQLCRRTDDRYRDVSDRARAAALDWLQARSAAPHGLELVREGGQLRAEEQRTVFGETLPRGLRID
jgi:molecular chaperone DnaK (HSP70)